MLPYPSVAESNCGLATAICKSAPAKKAKPAKDRSRSASRILKDPTARLDILRTAADTLLHLALTDGQAPRRQVPAGRSVQRLGITLSGLTELPGRQAQLFAQRTDLLPGLIRAMDARFPGKLTRPVRAHADPFFPEEEYHFEPVTR